MIAGFCFFFCLVFLSFVFLDQKQRIVRSDRGSCVISVCARVIHCLPKVRYLDLTTNVLCYNSYGVLSNLKSWALTLTFLS